MLKQHFIKSYGRTVGRSLSLSQKKNLAEYQSSSDLCVFKKTYKSFILEIGFGNGENIIKLAQENSEIGIIGVDPFKNSCVKSIDYAMKHDLKNIFILNGDIRDFIFKFEDKFFQKSYVLFPDPWPKIKHRKRRLLNEEFVDTLINKTSSSFVFATDSLNYFTDVCCIMKIKSKTQFITTEKPGGLIADTKYEQKAKMGGRIRNYAVFSDFYDSLRK